MFNGDQTMEWLCTCYVHLIWSLVFCELIFFLLHERYGRAFKGWEPADTQLSRIKADLFSGHLGTADQTVTTTLTFIFPSYKVDTTNSCLFTHPTDGAALAFVWCCVSGGVPAAVSQTLTTTRPSFWWRQKGAFLVFPQGACFSFNNNKKQLCN